MYFRVKGVILLQYFLNTAYEMLPYPLKKLLFILYPNTMPSFMLLSTSA